VTLGLNYLRIFPTEWSNLVKNFINTENTFPEWFFQCICMNRRLCRPGSNKFGYIFMKKFWPVHFSNLSDPLVSALNNTFNPCMAANYIFWLFIGLVPSRKFKRNGEFMWTISRSNFILAKHQMGCFYQKYFSLVLFRNRLLVGGSLVSTLLSWPSGYRFDSYMPQVRLRTLNLRDKYSYQ